MILYIVLFVLGCTVVGSLAAIWRGPTPLDRLLAADFMTLPISAMLMIWGTLQPESHAREIALVAVIAGFVGVVVAAPRLVKKREES